MKLFLISVYAHMQNGTKAEASLVQYSKWIRRDADRSVSKKAPQITVQKDGRSSRFTVSEFA